MRGRNPTLSWCDVDLIVKTDGGVFFEFSCRSEIDLGKKGSTYPRYWSNRFSPPNDKILKRKRKFYKNGLVVGYTFCQRFFFHKRTSKGKKLRKRSFAQVSPKRRKKGEQWPIRLHKLPKLAPPCQCHQGKKTKKIKSNICMQVSFGMSSLKWESFLET